MAVGDDAAAAGFALVSGSAGLITDGDLEFNRTRDYVAQVKALIPVGHSGYQSAAGISAGTADPSGGSDGDIYFKILP
jgi:hypothetical protein